MRLSVAGSPSRDQQDPLEPLDDRRQRGDGERHQTARQPAGKDVGHPVRAQIDGAQADSARDERCAYRAHPSVPPREA
jgi:hypothetical protein